MSKIMVLGSINMDVVARTARHPRPGETVFGHDLQYFPGGKGANQAVAASRLYPQVYLIGKLGQDAFGQTLHQFLQGENLDLTHLMLAEAAPTGTALIIVDENSENSIVVVPGSNGSLTVEDVAGVQPVAGDVVVSQFEVPQAVIRAVFQRARASQAITLLNAAPAVPCLPDLLPFVDYLIVNETELAFFAHAEPGEAEVLIQQGRAIRAFDDQCIVVTLGAKGSLCIAGEAVISVPGFAVQALDTTGAGDCFVGALAAGLAGGGDLRDALYLANAAAALSVQKAGASPSMPGLDEVRVFMQQATEVKAKL
ncbi:MAG: ribokinase [Anaerolineae bacterium]|nr:ribokinase [Anaerolineae bacterium]